LLPNLWFARNRGSRATLTILKGATILYPKHGKEIEMKKGKGTWLPLALMLAAGSALLPVGCDTGDDSGKEGTDPIPARTGISIDGQDVSIASEGISGDTNILRIIWKEVYQGKTNTVSVSWGHDYLDDPAVKKLAIKIAKNSEENPAGVNITQADIDNIMAKLGAAIPTASGKTLVFQALEGGVNKVSDYTAGKEEGKEGGGEGGKEPEGEPVIPDATSITFNGREVKIIHYEGEIGDTYHMMQIRWRNEYKNNIDKMSVTLGKDYLEDGKAVIVPTLFAPDGETLVASNADYEALKAKIQAALPPESTKFGVVSAGSHYNVTLVENYAAMIKEAFIRLAESTRANIGRGA
jgi:hypothetical protein